MPSYEICPHASFSAHSKTPNVARTKKTKQQKTGKHKTFGLLNHSNPASMNGNVPPTTGGRFPTQGAVASVFRNRRNTKTNNATTNKRPIKIIKKPPTKTLPGAGRAAALAS
jgi:hypothetical protein